jgi:retinol-binding protein 3
MHIRTTLAAAGLFCLASAVAYAGPTNAGRDAIVDQTLARIKDDYVHPDKFGAIEASVREHQQSGDYAAASDDKEFAALLTLHLQEITNDKHMSLKSQPNVRARRPAAFQSSPAQREAERRENYGLHKAEILAGNVGYLDIAYFHDDVDLSGDTIAATMAFLANTDALIIDLRNNRGGGMAMPLLASYLMDGGIEVMQLRYRKRGTMHAMTQEYLPGKRYLAKPVYLLTSNRTFSAGEAFSCALQELKRATLVGRATRGGGNPNEIVPVGDDYALSVPIGESISPVNRISWEGVGVKPDIEVDEQQALAVAHRQALGKLREASQDTAQRESLDKAIAALDQH